MTATDNPTQSEVNKDSERSSERASSRSEAQRLFIVQGCSLLEGESRDRGIAMIWKALEERPTKENFLYVLKALIANSDILLARKVADIAIGQHPNNPEIAKMRRLLWPGIPKPSSAKARNLSKEVQWIKEHAAEYRGKWVILAGDRLLAADESLHVAREKSKNVISQMDFDIPHTIAMHPLVYYIKK